MPLLVLMFCLLSVFGLDLLVAVVVLFFINTCMRQAKSVTVDLLFPLQRLRVFVANKPKMIYIYFDFRSISMKTRFATLNLNLITALTR